MPFTLESSAFPAGGAIPSRYTCDGDDRSPPLAWRDPPAGTHAFVLIVDDPDAPDPHAPKRVWVHWLLYNLPAAADALAEAVHPDVLPAGTREGTTDAHTTGWHGPCPPVGRHRYFFRLHALDAPLADLGTPNRRELEAAMAGHVLGTAELMGTYARAPHASRAG